MVKGYTNNSIKTLGLTNVLVNFNNKISTLPVIATCQDDKPILGLNWFQKLGIDIKTDMNQFDDCHINVNDKVKTVMDKYNSIFEQNKIGIKGHVASIKLNNTFQPKIFKHRNIPYALREKLEIELNKLVEQGVIEKIEDVSSTINLSSSIVYVEKQNGDLKINGDFKVSINRYIDCLPYPLSTFDEIVEKIKGGTYYLVIDLKDAYLQLPFDDESPRNTNISTHLGFYKYKRLPF